MNHLMKKEELKKIVAAFERDYNLYKAKNSKFNEQMTRQQYIDKFLRLLGWDISNPDNLTFNDREVVAEEYSNRFDRPDYSIRMNSSSIFYVEAKKVSVDIDKEIEPAMQVRRYGWNSGHRISVLTNFEYLAIYTTYQQPKEKDTVANNRYKLYHYKDFVDKFDEIYDLLSRESVVSGKFDYWTNSIAPSNATKLALDQVFLEQLNEWRLLVAKDLITSSVADFKDPITLNESVQIFLNQLIFLRFIEDNRFEDTEKLKRTINKHIDYQSYFKDLDKRYNSGIFETPDVILNIKESTLKTIVESLYFPNASYDFSVIDLSILSRIYENFLQEEIVFDTFNNVKLEKTKSAKIKAVISTPDSLVKLMVQKVMKKKIDGLTPDEILRLKIGDLAVGSGIFLIETYNYIENYLVDWYSNKEKVAPTPYLVPFKIKKKIIQNVLRGFDINNQAVQLTRFSLLLRLLSYEKKDRIKEITPLLPSLKDTIVCGNSLVNESDIDYTTLSYEDATDIVPMSDTIFDGINFDIIVGNPPYLQTKEILESTSEIEIEIYKSKYYSAYKQYDKYFLFIERTLELLDENGIAILLVPNKFFTVGAANKLRERIYQNQGLSSILDFKTTQLFQNVINYVAVVQFGKFSSPKFQYSVVKSVDDAFKSDNGLTYDIRDLGNSHWFLTQNEELRSQYRFAMNNFPNIESEITPVNGIQTSANTVFLLDKKFIVKENEETVTFKVTKKKDIEYVTIEKALLKEFYQTPSKVQGKSYMQMKASKYVIFPYINGKIIDYATMEAKYPNTLSYLIRHKKELLPKSLGGKRDVQYVSEWYQYGRTQFLKESNVDKILVGVMSNQPNFNIDRNRMLFASGGTAGFIALLMKQGSPYSLEYIQAWLSHPFTDMIFQTIGSSFEGEFYTHGTGTYKDIPLLPIDFTNNFEFDRYKLIEDYVKKIESINNSINLKLTTRELEFKEKKKAAYIDKINTLFNELIQFKVENQSE
ncbi:restriction endonuclease [Enterococcus faecalis]|nr:restriction endonuclease [Enterococcus faecalis]EGO9476306.1 restriction endonuclease [Enterococcus faecalis]